jgi:hypothetical protein
MALRFRVAETLFRYLTVRTLVFGSFMLGAEPVERRDNKS